MEFFGNNIMRLYENIFIGRQDLSQPQIEGIAENFSNIIERTGGKVVKSEYCGLRVCAYPIRKNRKGHYFYSQIEASSEAVKEAERYMKLNEEVLRFLTVQVKQFDTGVCPLIQQTNDFFAKNDSSTADKGYRPKADSKNDDIGAKDSVDLEAEA